MTNFEALPNELLVRIIALSDRKSLMQLRLTNKRLENIAVRKLFERVALYAHWVNGEKEETDQIAERSVDDPATSVFSREAAVEKDYEDQFIPALDEEDQFIPASDDDDEDGFTAASRLQGQGQRSSNSTHDRIEEKDDDNEFLAASDTDEDLPPAGDNSGHPRPPTRCVELRRQQESRELSGPPPPPPSPPPPPPIRRVSDFQSYEMRRRQQWEASRPQWARDYFPGPPNYDAAVFLNVLENNRLREMVKKVDVYTCETHCDHHPKTSHDLYHDIWPSPEFHARYLSSIERLGEFPNLRWLTVHFDRHGAGPFDEPVFQHRLFQRSYLEKLVDTAKNNITRVAIRHLENSPMQRDEGELKMPKFLDQVAAATSLRLSVKHVEFYQASGTTYRNANIQAFWDRFPGQFLQPANNNLTTLVLYSDLPLGWFPKLDLRAVHLPKLSSLTLGHHILHDERQIDWIVSHQDTLRELIFDRCAILYQMGCAIPDWLDEDGYPREDIGDYGEYGISPDVTIAEFEDFNNLLFFKSNHFRWSTVFSRLASSLPHLHDFRFGTSTQWNFKTKTTHFMAGATTRMPIMPWEDEHSIESKLFEERYVIWDDWENEYRPTWTAKGPHGGRYFGVGWQDEWLAKLDAYPECEKEDLETLRALLDITKGRL